MKEKICVEQGRMIVCDLLKCFLYMVLSDCFFRIWPCGSDTLWWDCGPRSLCINMCLAG